MISKLNKLNNRVIIISLIIICLLSLVYLGLTHSSRFNNFVFSNVVNPYDPLKVQTSQPVVKQLQQNNYWQDPRDLFPIIAFNLPDGSKDLSASLKIMEKGGINVVINGNLGWMPTPYKIKSAFEKLGDSNLKWLPIIENECKDDFIFRNSNDEINSNIKNFLNAFNENYVYGWFIWDEPGNNRKLCTAFNIVPNDDNADINTMVKQIRSDSLYNKKLDYVNLYPTYWDGTPTAEDYEKYIDAFLASQEYKPRVLCLDHYPFLKNEAGGFRKDYYLNLEIIRKKSFQYEVPFWMIVLTSGHLNYKNPTFEEISFQVFSALAYGAKGIGYYLYSKSWDYIGYTSWILENNIDNPNLADSMYGPLYLPVKKLNENVQEIGKILLNLKSIEVIHTSDYPNQQKRIEESVFEPGKTNTLIQKIENMDGSRSVPDLLIGVFSDDQKTNSNSKYLLVVNKNAQHSSEVEIYLTKFYDIYKFDYNKAEFSKMSNGTKLILKILPGSGEFILLR
jgi:hypothetical protein